MENANVASDWTWDQVLVDCLLKIRFCVSDVFFKRFLFVVIGNESDYK